VNLVWRVRAEQQLRSQLAFLRKKNPHAAKRMRTRIKLRITRLRSAPFTGRPSRRHGIRELVIVGTPYIAVYQVSDDTITILEFFHASEERS
jgi:plasmid stabilization system protein ParE